MTTEIQAEFQFNYDETPVTSVGNVTFLLSYEEVEEAFIDYLRKIGDINPGEIVISTDIPVELSDNGIFFGLDMELGAVEGDNDV